MSDSLETGFDPAARELCPDGMCLGVIGADGRCNVCGKEFPGGAAPRLAVSAAPAVPGEDALAGAALEPSVAALGSPVAVEGDAFEPARRELCPDGMCLGVIGADGRCKICGKPRGS